MNDDNGMARLVLAGYSDMVEGSLEDYVYSLSKDTLVVLEAALLTALGETVGEDGVWTKDNPFGYDEIVYQEIAFLGGFISETLLDADGEKEEEEEGNDEGRG